MSHRFVTYLRILLVSLTALTAVAGARAQALNDHVLNRPYADMRRWHLGFSVGLHTQDITFVHNGEPTPDGGEVWYMDQPSFSPGFCVNGLIDLRLNSLLNLRFTPGMYFGNRDITMREYETGETLRQNLKSTFIVLPFDLKFSGMRYRQSRPYITAGVMPAINLTRGGDDYLRTRPMDVYLTAGFGCDFYLPYFKFIPEVKFCFGLNDIIEHNRPDLEEQPDKLKITQALKRALSRMVVVTFYFE